jgi:23S rRNA pseudouridine1911/1915/1917 synthase
MNSAERGYSTVGMEPVQGSDTKRMWKISAAQAGMRMEAFVRLCLPHLSRRQAIKAVEENAFVVNAQPAKKGYRLRESDVVMLHGSADWLNQQPPPFADLQPVILYEDADVLAVNKPGGLPTHGFSGCDKKTLANLLIAARPELSKIGKSRWEPGLVHRLDTETSGLVLVAKTQRSFESLRAQFHHRQIGKTYLALVWGEPAAAGNIGFPLTHDSQDKSRMAALTGEVPSKGVKSWSAQTRFRKLASSASTSLLEIQMKTGVTHQIRVHLAAIGHPIVADGVYGLARSEKLGLKRHFLHAHRLRFFHPSSSAQVEIMAPLPTDLTEVLNRLKLGI